MEADFTAHLARIKRHLEAGRDTLVSMHGGTATVYNVPDALPDGLLVTLDPPNPGDRCVSLFLYTFLDALSTSR